MARDLPDELVLSSPAQWRAISSSVRLQMVDLLRMIGPCAVPRLAEALDRPGDGLYHHMRILERAGIVKRVGEERVGPRMQAVYSVAAKDVRLPVDRKDAKSAKQLTRVTSSLLRTADRGVSAAIRAGGIKQTGPERNLWCRIHTGRVDAKRLARLNALLREIEDEIEAGRSSGEGTTMSLVMAFWPSTGGRRYDGTPSLGHPPTGEQGASRKTTKPKANNRPGKDRSTKAPRGSGKDSNTTRRDTIE
ncbi:MAG: helix-turn-helix domain-containing protein [Phycisphaerales bacterium]|nr:helix-turn-helix domain-containing protein [Phycisphaerales bacterium]